MYAAHPAFKSPDENVVLWRYLDFTKFISLLETSSLYFTRSDNFSDIFEGTYNKRSFDMFNTDYLKTCRDLGISKELAESTLLDIKKSNSHMRRYVAINCWHMNESESAAMWQLYLKSNEGIVIKSSFGNLKKAIEGSSEHIMLGEVSYLDYSNDIIPYDNVLTPFMCKRKSFEHERELRAIILKLPVKDAGIAYTDETIGHGMNIQCDLDMLINEIYVAPNSPKWFVELIKSIIVRYGKSWNVQNSKLDEEPFY